MISQFSSSLQSHDRCQGSRAGCQHGQAEHIPAFLQLSTAVFSTLSSADLGQLFYIKVGISFSISFNIFPIFQTQALLPCVARDIPFQLKFMTSVYNLHTKICQSFPKAAAKQRIWLCELASCNTKPFCVGWAEQCRCFPPNRSKPQSWVPSATPKLQLKNPGCCAHTLAASPVFVHENPENRSSPGSAQHSQTMWKWEDAPSNTIK